MTNDDQWVILRQVIVAAPDDRAVAAEWQDAYGLGEGFADPELEGIGLDDVTLRVGPEAYLQAVAPANSDVPLVRWLERNGGPGGYVLSIQVPDVEARMESAAAAGIDVVLDTVAFDQRIVHLHPKRIGLILELDEIDDPDVWFWDELQPALDTAQQVTDVAGVEMSAPDPDELARLWAAVFDVDVDTSSATPTVWLGSRAVRFVPGERVAMSAIELTAGRAEPSTRTIAGVETRVVTAQGVAS